MVHENTSQKGRATLTERASYSNVVSRRRNTTTYWCCSVRNCCNTCPATVTQNGTTEFQRGQHKHNHAAAVGIDTAIPLVRSVKNVALQQPASDIVDKQLKDVDLSQPCLAMPPIANIITIANRYRSTQRPKEPEDLSFVLDNDHSPAHFLRADVYVIQHEQRHLGLASSECMCLLGLAKLWYKDGTFSVVGKPFKRLLSIHCTVKATAVSLRVDVEIQSVSVMAAALPDVDISLLTGHFDLSNIDRFNPFTLGRLHTRTLSTFAVRS